MEEKGIRGSGGKFGSEDEGSTVFGGIFGDYVFELRNFIGYLAHSRQPPILSAEKSGIKFQ